MRSKAVSCANSRPVDSLLRLTRNGTKKALQASLTVRPHTGHTFMYLYSVDANDRKPDTGSRCFRKMHEGKNTQFTAKQKAPVSPARV